MCTSVHGTVSMHWLHQKVRIYSSFGILLEYLPDLVTFLYIGSLNISVYHNVVFMDTRHGRNIFLERATLLQPSKHKREVAEGLKHCVTRSHMWVRGAAQRERYQSIPPVLWPFWSLAAQTWNESTVCNQVYTSPVQCMNMKDITRLPAVRMNNQPITQNIEL